MNIKHYFLAVWGLAICLGACQPQGDYCTVKGSVKGLKDGTRLELVDEYDHFKAIATTRVKDGAFEFRPDISAPTHVYLYTADGRQLKDFFLEPGTITADVDATDENDYLVCGTGTPSNDMRFKIRQLQQSGTHPSLMDEVLDAQETGILALYYADGHGPSAVKSLGVLDRLSEDIASKPYVASLREELTRRAKTEPAPEGSGSENHYIDMEYPDADGNLISLSSVVNNPANRYVLLDFWAVWCDPCRDAVPELRALYEKYHEKGLEIYSVSEDQSEARWKAFIADNGMTWINVLDDNGGRKNSKAWFDYALHGIPTTILIDGQTGAILLRGNLSEMEAVLSSMLK